MVTPPPAAFRNGEAPLEWFHVLRSGMYSGPIPAGEDAGWAQLLTPAMLDFHNRLVARAFRRTGRTLQLSTGCSAYRPKGDQRRAKRLYGRGAAAVGTSSHGLWFEGAYSAAFDYGNWESVYAGKGGKAAWYADVRAEGGIAGYFDRDERPGTVHEPWHVIIRDPFRLGVASNPQYAGGVTVPAPAIPQEEIEMIAVRITGTVDGKAVEHFVTLGPKVIRHITSQDDRTWLMKVIQPDDRWVEATLDNFAALALSFGVARDAYVFFGGAMLVKENGENRPGGMWNG